MILDERTEFCDAVACNTGAAATYNVGDQIDLGLAGRSPVSAGDHLYLVIQVDTGIKVATSTGTIQFQLVSDDSDSIATNGTQKLTILGNNGYWVDPKEPGTGEDEVSDVTRVIEIVETASETPLTITVEA